MARSSAKRDDRATTLREAPQACPFQRRRRFFRLLNLGIALTFLAWLLWGNGSLLLRDRLASHLPPGPGLLLAYTLLAVLLLEAITLPIRYFGGFHLERRYGLSTQKPAGFFADHIKALALGVLLMAGATQVLYLLLAHFPTTWWLWLGAIGAAASLLLTQLLPILLVPLFFRLRRIEDVKLVSLLSRLAGRCGTRIEGIYEIVFSAKTRQANAALMGLGRTRRIVLSDTLLRGFTAEETAVILAHELGHHRLGHIGLLLSAQVGMAFGMSLLCRVAVPAWLPAFNYQGLEDVAALPLYALVILLAGFALLPLLNCQSRRLEYAADRFALELTEDAPSFESGMEKLARLNLAEVSPSGLREFLFHGHPSIEKRVRAARTFPVPRREGGSPPSPLPLPP